MSSRQQRSLEPVARSLTFPRLVDEFVGSVLGNKLELLEALRAWDDATQDPEGRTRQESVANSTVEWIGIQKTS